MTTSYFKFLLLSDIRLHTTIRVLTQWGTSSTEVQWMSCSLFMYKSFNEAHHPRIWQYLVFGSSSVVCHALLILFSSCCLHSRVWWLARSFIFLSWLVCLQKIKCVCKWVAIRTRFLPIDHSL